MAMNNGVMTMRALDKGLAIEPGKTVKFAPGGYHLMLMDLKSPLKQGDKLPVTLEFEKAGKVKLAFDVQGVGAQGPAAGEGHSGGHDSPFRREEVRPIMSKIIILAAVATLAAWPAAAHVSLENRQATIGAGYKAVFTVPHGCAGSATTKIRVQIPEGVIAVKPMPKAGWSVEAISGKYATEYSYHGSEILRRRQGSGVERRQAGRQPLRRIRHQHLS